MIYEIYLDLWLFLNGINIGMGVPEFAGEVHRGSRVILGVGGS